MRLHLKLLAFLAVSACGEVIAPVVVSDEPQVSTIAARLPSPQQAADNFVAVVDLVEPVAERICRAEAPASKCDYQIIVDNRPNQPPNAYQTLDRNGRPIIAFTIALIAEARNRDELAFILGHEAAHHIAGHIERQRDSALRGALLAGVLAGLGGAQESGIRNAQDFGAVVGARAYSKDFELEADALGTVIAFRAGFDPEAGAQYFARIADPGNRFLGTHPPNAQRIQTVRRTLAALQQQPG